MYAFRETLAKLNVIMPKSRLVRGEYYVGVCRNARVARWDGERFHHWRLKFGVQFVETIHHREDDAVFDVFDPIFHVENTREVTVIPIEELDRETPQTQSGQTSKVRDDG